MLAVAGPGGAVVADGCGDLVVAESDLVTGDAAVL
jgi:hypothetical protein